ncbi:MAG: hypothetical protein RQ751_09855, partial [Longimicrobiales bacterium]|nr:hypothetical protein [Longimicrobiales bacterium]
MSGAVWAVIRREYLQRVRSRWFVIGSVAGPLLLIGVMALPVLMASGDRTRDRALGLVDRTGLLAAPLASRLEEGGFTVADAGDEARLAERVEARELAGYLVVDEGTLARGEARYHARGEPSPVRALALRQAVVQAALEVRLGG